MQSVDTDDGAGHGDNDVEYQNSVRYLSSQVWSELYLWRCSSVFVSLDHKHGVNQERNAAVNSLFLIVGTRSKLEDSDMSTLPCPYFPTS